MYLGEELADDNPMRELLRRARRAPGSVIAVVATDAPFFPHQCKALARRVTLGLARTGTTGLALLRRHLPRRLHRQPGRLHQRRPGRATATAPGTTALTFIPWGKIDPFYEAVVQATEEAVANALIANEDMTGRDGHRSPALPRHRLAEILARPEPA